MNLDSIINKSEKMRDMLKSVYFYNSQFIKDKKQEKLLSRILEAMLIIDRKFFAENEEYSYLDTALGIGERQTISQPSTVARMLMLAELEEGADVLEVGTGSGWNASLISFLVSRKVTSIERISKLAELARDNLLRLKTKLKQEHGKKININIINENFFSHNKKYDRIIITAGISDEQLGIMKRMAKKLLNKKGILVCPRTYGKMLIFKNNKKLEIEETKEEYVFVPLLF